MKACVIIVTYNASSWLKKCIESIFDSSKPSEIIVFDNNSSDNTVQILNEFYPTVELIVSKENLGFGKANNIGLKKAIAKNVDYIFLLNQDAWVNPDTIEGLINVHKTHPEFGILSPIHLNGVGSALDYRFSLSCNVIDCPGFISDIYLAIDKNIHSISFVNAALWLVTKECILAAGLFDPIFPHYGEDLDYTNRVKYHGLKIGICQEYKGFHDRENRPHSGKRERVMSYLSYICILKDPSRSFINANLIVLGSLSNKIFKDIFKLNLSRSFSHILTYLKIIFTLPIIIKSRKICKNKSAYLYIND